MDITQAITIGIIEGFTEFLPISSTGHMIVASNFMGIPQNALMKAYEVIIQFAAILAVMIVYRDKITIKKIELWKRILLAFLPLLVIGYIFKDQIKLLFSLEVVAWMFIVGGVVFIVVESIYKDSKVNVKEIENVSYSQALWIGFAQLFSFVPGTSRAGATIVGGMLVGLNRKASSDFSFLLAIPVMSAVTFYDLLKHYKDFVNANMLSFIVGFVVAFIVAYITIKLFLIFIQRFNFIPFAIYRIVFGIYLLTVI